MSTRSARLFNSVIGKATRASRPANQRKLGGVNDFILIPIPQCADLSDTNLSYRVRAFYSLLVILPLGLDLQPSLSDSIVQYLASLACKAESENIFSLSALQALRWKTHNAIWPVF